jgi:hypothetical protein
MRISLCDTRCSAQWAVIFLLLALLCTEGTREAAAELPAPVSEQNRKYDLAEVPVREISAQVDFWSAHCAQFEKNTFASQCWLDAAGVIDGYARRHPLTKDLRALRMDWLLRGLLLSLTPPEAEDASIEGKSQRSGREPTVKAARVKGETPLRKDRKEKVGKPVPLPPELAALSQRLYTTKKQNFTSSYVHKD